MDSGRLSRGRSYAAVGPGAQPGHRRRAGVGAGARLAAYALQVNIAVLAPLADAEWKRAIDAMAEQAIFAAKLLNGEMPENIEEAFAKAKVSLFPVSGAVIWSRPAPVPTTPTRASTSPRFTTCWANSSTRIRFCCFSCAAEKRAGDRGAARGARRRPRLLKRRPPTPLNLRRMASPWSKNWIASGASVWSWPLSASGSLRPR